MPSVELQQLVTGLRAGGPDFTAPPQQARAEFAALLETLPVADDIRFDEIKLGGVPVLRSEVDGQGPGALLYFHGGAFVVGSAGGYRALAAELARAAGATGYSVEYRLAPEHPFPAAVEDAVAAYRTLLETVPPAQIVVAGDSAGGGLALSLLVKLRDDGLPLPAAALLISPWVDLACEGGTVTSKAASDPSLTPAGLRAMAGHYLGGAEARSPLASPLYADLAGLSPLLVQVGSEEILLDDAVRLAGAAGAAGTAVQLEIWPDMVHVWHAFAFLLPEGRQAIAAAGQFLRQRIGAAA